MAKSNKPLTGQQHGLPMATQEREPGSDDQDLQDFPPRESPAPESPRQELVPVPQTATPLALMSGATKAYPIFAYSAQDFSQVLSANLGGGGVRVFDLERIKLPSGAAQFWSVTDENGEEQAQKELEGIIVNWRDTRSYWEKGFQETGGGSPPDCSSPDALTGVGRPGGLCLKCPKAQFGTGKAGVGQACRLSRILFYLRPGRLLPNVIFVGPGSLEPVRKYFLGLASVGMPYNGLITKLSLTKDTSCTGIDFAKVSPKRGEKLTQEQVMFVRGLADVLKPQFAGVEVKPEDIVPGENLR